MFDSARDLTASTPQPEHGFSQRRALSVLDLVAAATDVAETEAEVVAIVSQLLRSGRVRISGQLSS